jgi:LDH2 family malate/lactate/ureidoglycolate dehydrogenase
MAADATGMTRINHEKLIRFVSRSFEKLGVPAADAEIAANVLPDIVPSKLLA